ncbi:uncharacterized protein LOC122879680 isoform X2 [Siniperca chuatsi]|uniref:uncharacterized protein LOC122879680 isoform X2 n=1 Tax=Siniperca chuatsi TaxID=119488 RepID=UPI001CE02BEB|nr:uncharacterized protein LOC122879680 isoform X2 [Siniperca chuatsi]
MASSELASSLPVPGLEPPSGKSSRRQRGTLPLCCPAPRPHCYPAPQGLSCPVPHRLSSSVSCSSHLLSLLGHSSHLLFLLRLGLNHLLFLLPQSLVSELQQPPEPVLQQHLDPAKPQQSSVSLDPPALSSAVQPCRRPPEGYRLHCWPPNMLCTSVHPPEWLHLHRQYPGRHSDLLGPSFLPPGRPPKLKETDSVLVVIMSHGKLGAVLGVNCKNETSGDETPDEFPVNNIYKHLGSEKCSALLNKPKIIIIQACRGGH